MKRIGKRRWGRIVGVVGVVVVVVPLLAALLLQLPQITTRIARELMAALVPDGADARVKRVALRGHDSLEIDDFVLVRSPADTAFAFDRLTVRYSLVSLLRKSAIVHELHWERPFVSLLHPNDSTWTLLPSEAAPAGASEEAGAFSWTVRVDQANVRDGAFEAVRSADVVDRLENVNVSGLSAEWGSSLAAAVERASGDLRPAGPAPEEGRFLVAGGAWNGARLELDTLSLHTASSSVTGGGTVASSDTSSQTAFRLELAPLALSDLAPFAGGVGEGSLTGSVDVRSRAGGALDFSVHLQASGGGRIDADGEWRDRKRLRARGKVEGIDPGVVLRAAPAGSASLTFDVDLEGTELARLDGHADLVVGETVLDGFRIDEASLASRFRDGRGDFELSGTAQGVGLKASGEMVGDSLEANVELGWGGGRVTARASGAPFAERPELRLRDGRVESVDLARAMEGSMPTDLNAAFSGDVTWGGAQGLLARIDLAIDSSRVNDIRLDEGRLEVRSAGDAVSLQGDIAGEAGRVHLDVTGDPNARPLRYEVKAARFEDLDLAVIGAGWSTSLTGSLRLMGAGVEPATMTAEGVLELERSRIQSAELTSGRVSLDARSGLWSSDLLLELGAGRVEASGAATLAGERTYEAQAHVHLPELGALLGDSTRAFVDARLDVRARGSTRATLAGTAWITSDSLVWRDVRADSVRIDVEAAQGFVLLDTLRVSSNVARIEGSGRVPLVVEHEGQPLENGELLVTAALVSLEPLETSLGMTALSAQDGLAEFRVAGPADSLALSARAHMDALLANTTKIVGLDVRAVALYSILEGWRGGDAEIDLLRLGLPTTTVDSTHLSAEWEPPENLRIAARARIDEGRTAELQASLDTTGERPTLEISRFAFQVDEDRWTLSKPAHVRYGNGVDLEGFVVEASDQRIALDASVKEGELVSAEIAVDWFRVGTVADLAGFDDLAGTLTARADVRGTGADRRGSASVNFDVRSSKGAGALDATAEIEGSAARIDGGISQAEGRSLLFRGVVPLGASSSETLDLQVTADSLRVSFAEPFLPPDVARDLGGVLDADVQIVGSLASPRLRGHVALSDARMFLPAIGRTYDGIHVGLSMDGDVARVDRARVGSGDGAAVIEGEVELGTGSIGRYELSIALDDFHAVSTELLDAVVSGDLEVRGTVDAPEVSGTLTIEHGDLYLGEGGASGDQEDVVLDDADYAELEEYLGFPIRRAETARGPGFESVTLDVTVRARRDTWLRQSVNPELVVQLTGEINVEKDVGPDFRLVGELQAIPARSTIQQFGRRFRVREGVLTFRGPPEETRVDLAAAYEVPSRLDNAPEVVIVLGLVGQVGDLEVQLSSEPAMENADVLSYLATGRPAARSFDVSSSERGGVLTRGGNLALDQVTGLLESFAVDRVGLDVVEIRREGLDRATLVAGRYVSSDLYLGLQEPVAFGSSDERAASGETTQVEIELQVLRWLLLNVQSGGAAFEVFFRTRHGY